MSKTRNKPTEKDRETTRVSVTFPVEHYEKLESLAEENKVSIAWVVRDAVEQYLSNEGRKGRGSHGKKK